MHSRLHDTVVTVVPVVSPRLSPVGAIGNWVTNPAPRQFSLWFRWSRLRCQPSLVPLSPVLHRTGVTIQFQQFLLLFRLMRFLAPIEPPEPTGVNLARRGAVDRLHSMSCPETFSAETWNQILADAERFVGTWGGQSLLLDWSDNDLFGVFPDAPAARYDAMGLTLLMIELLQQCARLKTPDGSTLSYRKHCHVSAVPLWYLGDLQ